MLKINENQTKKATQRRFVDIVSLLRLETVTQEMLKKRSGFESGENSTKGTLNLQSRSADRAQGDHWNPLNQQWAVDIETALPALDS